MSKNRIALNIEKMGRVESAKEIIDASEKTLDVMKNLHRQAHILFDLLCDADKQKWNHWVLH